MQTTQDRHDLHLPPDIPCYLLNVPHVQYSIAGLQEISGSEITPGSSYLSVNVIRMELTVWTAKAEAENKIVIAAAAPAVRTNFLRF